MGKVQGALLCRLKSKVASRIITFNVAGDRSFQRMDWQSFCLSLWLLWSLCCGCWSLPMPVLDFFYVAVMLHLFGTYLVLIADDWSKALLKSTALKLFCAAVESEPLYAVVVSAASLLLFVYQYLMGHVDKGGTLTCSTGSFQFRATFISIVLFEGAYVWIKFRDVASSAAGGYRRRVKDKLSGTIKLSKPEARYTPPGQAGNNLYLGVCATDEEARIKKQIAAFYYGRDEGTLDLEHGHHFQIPWVQMEQERSLSVKEKRKWVRDKVREVYESFEKQKAILSASHHPSEVDAGDFCTSWEKFLLESPSDMMFDSQPLQQHDVQDDQVQASAMVVPTFNKQGDSPFHAEPLESAYLWGSQDFLDVAAPSSEDDCEVDVGTLTVEHRAPQKSSNCEFPMVSSIFTAQPGMDQWAALSEVFSVETFPDIVAEPLHDILDAQPQQPFESAQAQGLATGTLTSGDPVNAWTVDGNAQHDSEASKLPTESSIPPSPQQRSDVEAITELQQKVIDRDQLLQEYSQTIQAMKQMLELRDRRVSELELELLCQRRSSQ